MILKGKTANPSRKISYSAISSTINISWKDLGLKPGLSGESPAADLLSNDTTVLKTEINLIVYNGSAFSALYGTHTAVAVKSTQFIYSEKLLFVLGTIQNSYRRTVDKKYDFFKC
jgi:hypothetical protein